jgi:uncharacterized protein (TIGR02611 family)
VSGTGYARRQAWALVRRVAVAVVGGMITAAGVVLIFVPGPGLLVLLVGLAILATEFSWAHQVRQRVQRKAHSITQRLRAPRVMNIGLHHKQSSCAHARSVRSHKALKPSDSRLRKAARLGEHALTGSADEIAKQRMRTVGS